MVFIEGLYVCRVEEYDGVVCMEVCILQILRYGLYEYGGTEVELGLFEEPCHGILACGVGCRDEEGLAFVFRADEVYY